MTDSTISDAFSWLEAVDSDEALNWVRARNAETEQGFTLSDRFKRLEKQILAALDNDERIPYARLRGEYCYNYWRDAKQIRGCWRRTSLEQYKQAQPEWELLLDLDTLATAEGENWVWQGAEVLRPSRDRALISLSRGGADASVVREFDLNTLSFVEGGFQLAEAKSSIGWIDRDTVFVATDFGSGSLTDSGYPRQVKRWRRGTDISTAQLVFEGESTDMSIGAVHDSTPGFQRDFVYRARAFYNNELFVLSDDDTLQKIEVPDSASANIYKDWLFVELRETWKIGQTNYPAGSLLVCDFNAFMAGERQMHCLFEPTANSSLASYCNTRDYVLLNVLQDVKSTLISLQYKGGKWLRQPLLGVAENGSSNVSALDSETSNAYWQMESGYLTPPSLLLGEVGEEPQMLKSLRALFDATGASVEQHFAISADGTRVPYFQVTPAGFNANSENPALLYGYGGFEISLTPGYSAGAGCGWISEGGVYVVANIRGGGEYGPSWHQAALKENRHRAFEDFAAVAQDLVLRRITRPERLGIMGGSNGGLLVGNMVAHYPALFAAAVCQVPLLDMRNYHKLLAGASWMAEYGDPDDPQQWEFIRSFSPYHLLEAERQYPAVLFTTSTRDDRVHPAHARKMMALMDEQGHDVSYFENIEGGHGGAADNGQQAFMSALGYAWLWQKLAG